MNHGQNNGSLEGVFSLGLKDLCYFYICDNLRKNTTLWM